MRTQRHDSIAARQHQSHHAGLQRRQCVEKAVELRAVDVQHYAPSQRLGDDDVDRVAPETEPRTGVNMHDPAAGEAVRAEP